MKNSILFKTLTCFVLSGFVFFSYSCKNKLEDINAITITDTFPVSAGVNIESIYSDSAKIQTKLKAPLIKSYAGKNPYTEWPKGIDVIFYDSLMHVKTHITSKYAIKYEKKNIMEAKNDVIVVNEKGERLNTEHLIWDAKRRKIYTEVFVRITTTDKIFFGDGMDADESFLKWTIRKPRGTFYINDEELDTEKGE